MLYTIQAHEGESETAQNSIIQTENFEIQEEIGYGAFQVEGPANSIQELQSMNGVYAANRDGPIEFGDE